jgi:23S rRNA pseudouridine2605 synthase
MEERLQKILARAGYGSRRKCEELISAGRVTVNGKVATLGMKTEPRRDRIFIDQHPIKTPESLQYILVYKPRGVLSTVSDPSTRQTIRDLVPVSGTLYPVGRLDYDSEGLIFLTNDGELANRLSHPRYHHEKEYRVATTTPPDNEQLAALRHGIVLEDRYRTAPVQVSIESTSPDLCWLRITLHEGRKRQIREMCGRIGLTVKRIIRIRIGSLTLGNLKPSEWRYLSPQEIARLKRAV